jgi:hypothetical protein
MMVHVRKLIKESEQAMRHAQHHVEAKLRARARAIAMLNRARSRHHFIR